MKSVLNRIIPFGGFKCVNLFGLLFVNTRACETVGDTILSEVELNHEAIHTAQMKELGYVPFYLIYFIEWLVRLVIDPETAYRGLSFEREAYDNQDDPDYLTTRKHFAQWRSKDEES